MHTNRESPSRTHRRAAGAGTLWRIAGGLLCMLVAGPVRAQAPSDEPTSEPAEDASPVPAEEAVPTEEPQERAGDGEVPPTALPTELGPGHAADALAAPRVAPPTDGEGSSDPAEAAVATAVGPAPETTPERPRGWRFPRETVRRPLTLPQGVLRFDSTASLSVFGPNTFMVGYAGLAAGIFDDLELGAVPLGITFIPLNFRFSDPYVYGRVRVLSGDVQIAFRAGTTLPVAGQLPAAQMDLGGELAWRILPFFRIDTGIDYGALFASTFNQRMGIPLTATLQAGIQAIALVSGVYVFNDFDDVDVPLMLRYVVTFRGYQGPLGEFSMQGGFTDLEHADSAWTVMSRLTFFAYL